VPTKETPAEIEAVFDRLWPILRSITGAGVRRTHDILGELLPLTRIEVPTGTEVLDWVVPQEWAVREAYVVDPTGRRILDVADNNLHLLNYSIPFHGTVDRAELDRHLHSLPDQPDAIPYVTSYYQPRWGFCLSHHQRQSLPEGDYRVVIDSRLFDGSMTLSEAVLPGETSDEVLISTYTCHPSMANNELSGPLACAFLYRRLAQLPRRRLTYRFVFLPETIGAITYLHLHGEHLKRHTVAGYVVTCVGDGGAFTLKRSERGDSLADRAAVHCLKTLSPDAHTVQDWFPTGSDERQYCSPGFRLPVATLTRSQFGHYPQYHTSLDNKDMMSFDGMVGTVDMLLAFCRALDSNRVWRSTKPFGEPFLSRYQLVPTLSDPRAFTNQEMLALRWILSQADGSRDLLAVAERSNLECTLLADQAEVLERVGLLARN